MQNPLLFTSWAGHGGPTEPGLQGPAHSAPSTALLGILYNTHQRIQGDFH